MMMSTPEIVELESRSTAVISVIIPRSEIEMGRAFAPAVEELVAVLDGQNIPRAESVFAHHFRISPLEFDFEIGFTIERAVIPVGRVRQGAWPKMKVAHSVMAGSYAGLPAAWSELDSWIKRNGASAAADLWEHYSVGPHLSSDERDWRTNLYRPLLT